jgi:hypothetical protein
MTLQSRSAFDGKGWDLPAKSKTKKFIFLGRGFRFSLFSFSPTKIPRLKNSVFLLFIFSFFISVSSLRRIYIRLSVGERKFFHGISAPLGWVWHTDITENEKEVFFNASFFACCVFELQSRDSRGKWIFRSKRQRGLPPTPGSEAAER